MQKHAQKMVMERTPYKNRLFVIYAVKAAFERDPTVPRAVVEAVQYAVEDFTRQKSRALKSDTGDAVSEQSVVITPPARGGGNATLAAGAEEDHQWKQRLAEAIDLVMAHSGEKHPGHASASLDADALGGGGDDDSASLAASALSSPAVPAAEPPAPVARRKRFTDKEIRNLKAGVQIHGEGKWTQILQDARLEFDSVRTPVSLKDKWRHLAKKKSRHM